MLSRRLTFAAVALPLLFASTFAGQYYFSAQRNIERVTGWAVPAEAELRHEASEGFVLGGMRKYVFDLHANSLADDAFCQSMRLPKAVSEPDPVMVQARMRSRPSDLDAKPVCSLKATSEETRTFVSIEATRRTLVVQWITN